MAATTVLLVGLTCLPLWGICRAMRMRGCAWRIARWIDVAGLEGLFLVAGISLLLVGAGMWVRSVM